MVVNSFEKLSGKYSRKCAPDERADRAIRKGGGAMSVIGRMDKQVEEVLIEPIARRHEQAAREREREKRAKQEEASQRATEEDEPRGAE